MTAIIIEDEIPSGKRLEKLLLNKNLTVLSILFSVNEAILWFKNNHHPDLVFMDIKLRDDLCFKIFDKVDVKSKIIFTTAYDEYALKAFDYNSIFYLLKPIDSNKLDSLLLKIEKNGLIDLKQKELELLESYLSVSYKNSFLVSQGNSLKRIVTEDIVFFKSENNSTFIVTNENRTYSINQSLEKLEEQLNPNSFFRISRNIIINKIFIKEISNFNINLNISIHEQDLKISRLRFKTFIDFYKN